MSLINTLGSKALIGGIGLIATLGTAAGVASTNTTVQADFANVQTAITNKDLSAYKTAASQLVDDKSQAEKDKINATTQDELNTISDRQTKMQAVQDAIKNNDYEAFKANADTRMLERVTSQTDFDKLVTDYQARQAQATKIDDSIKNNDFAAFKTAEASYQPTGPDGTTSNRPTPTDAQLQTRFDKLVADYKADGTLPSAREKGFGGPGGFGGGFGGGRGGHGPEEDMGAPAPQDSTSTTSTSTSTTTPN